MDTNLSNLPITLWPRSSWPEALVDEYRIMLMDPTDGSIVGRDGPIGAAGYLGRLEYASRTRSNRGY